MDKKSKIFNMLNADEWFNMLLSMQAIDVHFKPSVVQILRAKIDKLKKSKRPMTSVDLCLINKFVEGERNLQKTSDEYLSDLSNLS